MEKAIQSKFLGGMLGSALGDAIGELAFEYQTAETLWQNLEHRDVLTYTDDTAMAIGLVESLCELGHLDPRHIGDCFRANFKHEPWRGYASGPPTIFALVSRHGGTYTTVAQSLFDGQGSYGNGAAMRIVSVGLFFSGAADLYEQARLSAIVTHAHAIGIDGAAVQAKAIAQAVALHPQESFSEGDFLEELLRFAQTTEMRDQLHLAQRLLEKDPMPLYAGLHLGNGVAAHQSVPFAIYAFLRHPQSFEACLACAAFHSADRDTVAAMACAISGAYLGLDGISQAWVEKIENRVYLEQLACQLAEKRLHDAQ